MKNMVISALAGYVIAVSDIWLVKYPIDRVVMWAFMAIMFYVVIDAAEQRLYERRMREWKMRRIINKLVKQNRP